MIKSSVLSNGVKCYTLEKRGFKGKEAMVVFKYGSCNNKFRYNNKIIQQPYGIAHFLEHKLFDEKDINVFEEFSKYGGISNAYTNFSSTAYYFNCSDNFYENLKILLKMVGNLYITDESINKEKDIIAQEINMYEDDPYWQIYFNTLKCCYKNNSVRESVAGSVESIENITKEELYKAYESFYTYDNCCVIAVGDIDAEKVLNIVDKDLKLNNSSNVEILKQYENGVYTKNIATNMPVYRSIYNIGFKENTLIDSIAKRISLNNIILKMLTSRSSRLWYRLYTKGIADNSFSGEYVAGEDYGCTIIKGEGSKYNEIYDALNDEINNILTSGVNNDTVKRLAKSLKGQMEMEFDNIANLTSLIADCFSKNTEVLDIYENYDKINNDDIVFALKNNYSDSVVSVVESM